MKRNKMRDLKNMRAVEEGSKDVEDVVVEQANPQEEGVDKVEDGVDFDY